jgi:hypothetical protein
VPSFGSGLFIPSLLISISFFFCVLAVPIFSLLFFFFFSAQRGDAGHEGVQRARWWQQHL